MFRWLIGRDFGIDSKPIQHRLYVRLGNEQLIIAEALNSLHLTQPTEEPTVGFGGVADGGIKGVESETKLRS